MSYSRNQTRVVQPVDSSTHVNATVTTSVTPSVPESVSSWEWILCCVIFVFAALCGGIFCVCILSDQFLPGCCWSLYFYFEGSASRGQCTQNTECPTNSTMLSTTVSIDSADFNISIDRI